MSSLVSLLVKSLPAMQETQETWVRKISWRRKKATLSSIDAGEFCGQKSLVDYSSWGHKESDMTD